MISTTRNLLKSLTAIALISVSLAAQQPAAPLFSEKTLTELRQIQAAALKSDRAYEWTAFLTNNIGPRFSGTPQAARAEQYVADEMRKLGLAVEMQKLKVPHWVRGEERAELVSWPGMAAGTVQKLVIKTLGGSIGTPPAGIEAEVVVVENFADLERLGRDRIAGKVVVFNYRYDRRLSDAGFGLEAYGQAVQYRSSGAIAAARLGAVASLVRSAGGSQNRLAHTGGMRYDPAVAKIPGAALSHEDADLIAHLAKQGKVRIRLKLGAETLPDADGHNVIADLRGSERPDEVVIVSGHLDSWDVGTGALDDAGGVAVSMQVPYILKQLGLRPKRTIRVIAYANEENGLV
ncbi:MAG TPA: M28 family peptidase, partial [Pyrinomonadaceae bacterium]|nr:M28 family peptidase [Pyrinomonadaceae bacterium]